jgi:hypothetical protein
VIAQRSQPCWLVNPAPGCDDIGEAHFDTRQQAITAAVSANADARIAGTAERYVVAKSDHRCFTVRCDGECGERLVDMDEELGLHFDSMEGARDAAEAYDWALERHATGAWCPTCGVPPFEVPPMPLPGQTAMF